MNSTKPIAFRVLLSSLLFVLLMAFAIPHAATQQPIISARVVQVLQIDGLLFKDLNKNGKMDVYEDWRQPIDERVKDLVAQMTMEAVREQLEDLPFDSKAPLFKFGSGLSYPSGISTSSRP